MPDGDKHFFDANKVQIECTFLLGVNTIPLLKKLSVLNQHDTFSHIFLPFKFKFNFISREFKFQ